MQRWKKYLTLQLMKIVVTAIMLLVVAIIAQSQDVPSNNFGMSKACYDAVVSFDVATMSEHFSGSVEVVTSKGAGVYSRNQAEQVLLNYFSEYDSVECKLTQEKNSVGTKMVIGTVKADKKNIRLFILTQIHNGRSVIQQIRLEE